jgi:mRNA interferase RelE/StbE
MLDAVADRRVRELIRDRINGLAKEPDKQGTPLLKELAGYRSLRAAGQRYRIVYRVDRDKIIVLGVGVGIRKEGDTQDIYALAKKLIRLGLLEPP